MDTETCKWRFLTVRSIFVGVVFALGLISVVEAQVVVDDGWYAFVIRENTTEGAPFIQNNDSYVPNAIEIVTFASSQKAALGTNALNGFTVSEIASLHIDRLDDVLNSGSQYGPYFNIWVTDGSGKYAVIANEPSDAEWEGSRWDVPNWDFLKTKGCKVYETPDASDGQPGTSWVATHTGKSKNLTFEDVADLRIEAPSAAYTVSPANGVGSGAPDRLDNNEAYGFNWVFGDTLANYVSGEDEGFVVANYSAVPLVQCATDCYVDDVIGSDSNGGTDWTDAKKTIQAAVDQVDAGGTVHVAAGLYSENITVHKHLSLIGAGSNDVPSSNTILRKNTNSRIVNLTASGLSTAAPILLQDLRIEPDGVYGIEVHNGVSVSYVKLDNVQVNGTNQTNDTESEIGLKVATDGSLSHLEIVDSAFDHLTYGWYLAKHGDWDGASNVTDVTVTDTSFSYNDAKGGYIEKLSDAIFTNCIVHNNGIHTSFWNNMWNGGFDINLKGGDYQNLTFNNMTFTDNGLYVQEGAALMIKARDDGGTYGVYPATLTHVTIEGGTFNGNERGIRLGEPGKNNAGPTNVQVHHAEITSNNQAYSGTDGSAYGGAINHTQAQVNASLNWWGDAAGPGSDDVYGDVVYCPWLDGAYPGGSPVGFCLGTIIVEKRTNPAGATDSFSFSGDAAGSITDGEEIVVSNVLPGTYISQEIVPDGWNLTDISCNDDDSRGDLGTQTAIFQVEAGETVSCIFTNAPVGSVGIEKTQTADETVLHGDTFFYELTVQNGYDGQVDFLIEDNLSQYVTPQGTMTVQKMGQGTQITEEVDLLGNELSYETEMTGFELLTITFEVLVNDLVELGDVITNQAFVSVFYYATNVQIDSAVSDELQTRVVPEPATLALLGIGLLSLLACVRRRQKP